MTVSELKQYLNRFEEKDEIQIYVPYIETIVSLDAPNKILKKGKTTILHNKNKK